MTSQPDNPITTSVLEIMRTCIELKTVGVDAFCDYSPHVNKLIVHVYPGGWQSGEPTHNFLWLEACLNQRPDLVLYKLNSIKACLLSLLPSDEKEVTPCQ